jgi:hypothetical protein
VSINSKAIRKIGSIQAGRDNQMESNKNDVSRCHLSHGFADVI